MDELIQRLHDIINEYAYNEAVDLIDLDMWETHDIQDMLEILDNELVTRFNGALDEDSHVH